MRLAAVFVLLTSLIASSALAFSVSLTKDTTGKVVVWPKKTLSFSLHPACSADLPVKVCQDELRASFTAWQSAPCTGISFVEQAQSPNLKLTAVGFNTNGLNELAFIENSAWEFGQYTLGVTSPVFYQDGAIIEADIAFNGLQQKWEVTGKAWSTDVRNVAVHEIGHFFGLQHNLGGWDPGNPPTMSPTADPNMKSRTPEADDFGGLCFLYPKANFTCASTAACPLVVADGDKGEFYAGQLTCTGGLCGGFDPNAPKGTKKLGEPCAANFDCVEPMFCQPVGSGPDVCAKDCVQGSSTCPSGFTCVPYAGDPKQGVCLLGKTGTKGEGAACSSGAECGSGLCLQSGGVATCQTPCTAQKPCGAGKTCSALPGKDFGVCEGQKQPLGTGCTTNGQCQTGICAGTAGGATCVQACSAAAPCPAGQGCLAINGGSACFGLGDTATGGACKTASGCKTGLCADLGKGFVCAQPCGPGACPSGQVCTPLQGGGGACTTPAKKLADGTACTDSAACLSGLCVGSETSATCVPPCSASKPCPAAMACVPLTGGGGACLPAAVKQDAGAPCVEPGDCKSALCVGDDKSAVCVDPCGPAACKAGFKCLPLVGGKSACFALGTAAPGAKCKDALDCATGVCVGSATSAYCSLVCAAQVECPCGMECVAGKTENLCVLGQKIACLPVGAACTKAGECAGGQCFQAKCAAPCSIFQAAPCPGGQKCLRLKATTPEGLCGAVGPKTLNAACTVDGQCASGFCFDGACKLACSPFGAATCPPGLVCGAGVGEVGVCGPPAVVPVQPDAGPTVADTAGVPDATAADPDIADAATGPDAGPGDDATVTDALAGTDAATAPPIAGFAAPPPSSGCSAGSSGTVSAWGLLAALAALALRRRIGGGSGRTFYPFLP